MTELLDFKQVDLYLLDQIFKGRITTKQRILDAGCGSGRNLIPLSENGYNMQGIDPDESRLTSIKSILGEQVSLQKNTIEDFQSNSLYDYIICNAVLHFASSHDHFDLMFDKLFHLLDTDGQLFIRMTSNIGLENTLPQGKSGVYDLPDGTSRYLLTRQKVDTILEQYHLKLLEPVKTVFVDGIRSMTTLVLSR